MSGEGVEAADSDVGCCPPLAGAASLRLVVSLIAAAAVALSVAEGAVATIRALPDGIEGCESVISLTSLGNAVTAASQALTSPGGFATAKAAAVRGTRDEHQVLLRVEQELTSSAALQEDAMTVDRAYASFEHEASTATASGALTAGIDEFNRSAAGYPSVIALISALLQRCVIGLAPPTNASRDYDYLKARAQWEGEGLVDGGVLQGGPMFLAAADLQHAVSHRPSETGYLVALAAVDGFQHLPDAMLTPAETRLAKIVIGALTRFFGIGLTTGSSRTSAFRMAAADWEKEPAHRLELERAPLRAALAALDAGARADPRDTAYAAPIADLQALLGATAAALASDKGGVATVEVAYLNTAFVLAGGSAYHFVLSG